MYGLVIRPARGGGPPPALRAWPLAWPSPSDQDNAWRFGPGGCDIFPAIGSPAARVTAWSCCCRARHREEHGGNQDSTPPAAA